MQPTQSHHPMTFFEKTDLFMKWIGRQQHVNISPKIRIADLRADNQGRGVVAIRDIQEGEELFTIPSSSVLTAQNSSFHKHCEERLHGLPSWAKLVLVMIYEYGKGAHSFWSSYLDILPESFDTLMHWSESELAELRGSAILDKIGRKSADEMFLSQLWPIVAADMQQFGQYASMLELGSGQSSFLKMCHTMASLIFSYGFDIDPDMDSDEEDELLELDGAENESEKGLIPLADLLNADGELNNAHLIQNTDSVTMLALKAIKTGEQVFNDFGDLPRSDLLRRYGYITDQYKRWDVVEISFSLVESVCRSINAASSLGDSYQKERHALAESWDVLDDGYVLVWPEPSQTRPQLPNEVTLLVKALSMDDTKFQKAESHWSQCSKTIGNEEYRGICQIWERILVERLQQYPTTIATDRNILKSPMGDRYRMAVEVRLGEKEILAHWLQVLRATIETEVQSEQTRTYDVHVQQSKRRKR